MTAKRFTMDNEVGMLDVPCCNIYDNEEFLGTVILSDGVKFSGLLNEQHETIERLNQQLRIFSDGLKAEIRETKEVFEDYSECVDEKKQLKKENEQLQHYKEAYGTEIVKIKQTIKDMIESERTELGKMTLRQLWRQIQ